MRAGRHLGDPTAGVPGRRLFVAVPLPEATTRALTELVGEVRAAALPTGARDLRWVRLDGLHLTLRFLGPTLDDRLIDASASVLETAAEERRSRSPLRDRAPFRSVAGHEPCGLV